MSWLRHTVTACAMLTVAGQPLTAQLPSLKPAAKEEAAKAETPDETIKRLQQWQQEARDMLARLGGGTGEEISLPAGIGKGELESRRRDLEQMLLIANSAVKITGATAEARKLLDAARAADGEWTGFKEPPPFPVMLLDDLKNERDSILAKRRSHESSLANFEDLLASTLAEAKTAEEAVNSAIAAVQNAAPDQAEAAKWRLEAARGHARLLAARAAYAQGAIGNSKERLAVANSELALVDRKLAAIDGKVVFSDGDFERIEKIHADRKKQLERESSAVAGRLRTAITARNRAQSALEALVSAGGGNNDDALALARLRVEAAESRIDSLQSITETLDGLAQIENLAVRAYQDRRVLMSDQDKKARRNALEELDGMSKRLRVWLNVLSNDRNACAMDLSKIESRATVMAADDPRMEPLHEQRAAASEKLATLERANQTATQYRRFITRWIDEYTPDANTGFFEKARALAAAAWEKTTKIWSWQVMSYDDKVVVDGQTITGKIPVTLGMLLRALLFFIVGYQVASWFAHRIQKTVVSRGHIAEAQAKTLRNWAMIVVGVALALGTLSFLKIPLTVFAFFGGALAIGLGFGMQTLIKNFISGIIVLAERQIRVGDILDVDGIVGTVVEVNTRSSIIRSPDDVETMIPNSMFLENRVTNWTLSSARMRRSVRVGVAYGTPPQQVIDILKECAERHGLVCKQPAPFVVFEDFADSALVFVLYFWLDLRGPANALVVASDLRLMIEKRLTEAGVHIPFPQRDMRLATSSPIQVSIAREP